MKKTKFNDNWQFWKDGGQPVPVTLPHDAMLLEARDPDLENGGATGFYPGGKYYYRKMIPGSPELTSGTALLEFEGVYMNARVSLNGETLGGWVYGYTGFTVDLTGKLVPGADNELLVEADNSKTPNSRWYSGSGIYRDVNLYTAGNAYLPPDGIQVRTLSHSPAEIEVRVEHMGGSVRCAVWDGGQEIAAANGDCVRFSLPDAKLWSAEHPHLYTLRAELCDAGTLADVSECRFGVRTIAWDAKNGLQINGETVKLRGGCIHHDHGPLGSRWYEDAERRRLTRLKELGYNAIRYSHNPANRGVLELCDELGLYLMDETFDQWKIPQTTYDYAAHFDAEHEKDVRALVRKDYSHPSVILYCVGNEITDTGLPYGALICRELSELFHKLDGTRPTTIAINAILSVLAAKMAEAPPEAQPASGNLGSGKANDLVSMMPQIIASITPESLEALIGDCVKAVDIVGYNYGDHLYEGLHRLAPERVILSSETFPRAIGQNWPMIERTPYVIGDFMWTAWDYLGEAGVGQPVYGTGEAPFSKPYPCQSADVGAVDLIGNPEPFAYYTAVVWGARREPYIAVRPVNHSGEAYTVGMWRMTDAVRCWTWPGREGRAAEVEVYAPGAQVELLCNGRSVGVQPLEQCRCRFTLPYEPGTLEAVCRDERGAVLGRDALRTAGPETVLTVRPEKTVCEAKNDALVYVGIDVTDGEGTVKALCDEPVSVTVEGPGVLEAVGSARAGTTERFDGGRCTPYYGRLLAIVRATGEQGTIRVTARGTSLAPAKAEITVQESGRNER